MTEKKDLTEQRAKDIQQARDSERALLPAVDIYENSEGIVLLADMPGVSKDRLNIEVDKDSLLIEGELDIEMPQGMEALYADISATRYRRSFALSSELDTTAVDAMLKGGLLTLHIPKRAEVRPRKVPVRID